MGRGTLTRWLKNLFGIKRDNKKEEKQIPSSVCHNPATIPPNISPAEAAWLKSFYSEAGKEQSKRAIAAVVRLTIHGRGTVLYGGHHNLAAVKIQTIFRGYLARKALKALKALVKLQGLVRGYLVRKQATATLHSMQALIRAQATVRANKCRAYRIQTQATISTVQESGRSEYTSKVHRRRLSSSSFSNEERPKSRTRSSISDFGDDPSLPFPIPTIQCGSFKDSDWGLTGEDFRSSATAQSTPRFVVTTPKTVCAEYAKFRNYMENTQSFKANLRSQSAPKQRPEPGPRKRLSMNEMMESRNSLSGLRMQRSCSQIQEEINFKNAVMGRLQLGIARERNW